MTGPVSTHETGRRLASERDSLIAAGVDPTLLAVPVAPDSARTAIHTVGCTNSQCRVVEYVPQDRHDRCPACYGRPES